MQKACQQDAVGSAVRGPLIARRENRGRDAKDYDVKCAWQDIAIEWHCLANRAATESNRDRELEHD